MEVSTTPYNEFTMVWGSKTEMNKPQTGIRRRTLYPNSAMPPRLRWVRPGSSTSHIQTRPGRRELEPLKNLIGLKFSQPKTQNTPNTRARHIGSDIINLKLG